MEPALEVSAGTLLGGRVTYRQPAQGYRTGIEPVLLAASVPARPRERVVEAGTGAGAGLLALCARVGNLGGVGLERDAQMARLAAENLAANGFTGVSIMRTDLESWRSEAVYDHAFANPPWHDQASTPSPDAARRGAKIAGDAMLGGWIDCLAAPLRSRGTLTLILPGRLFAAAAQALIEADCGEIALKPLWPKEDRPAKLVILQAIKGGKGASRVLPGLLLHRADGSYTEETERILRHGAAFEV